MQKQKFCVMAHQSKKLRNELETHRKMNTNLFVLYKKKPLLKLPYLKYQIFI